MTFNNKFKNFFNELIWLHKKGKSCNASKNVVVLKSIFSNHYYCNRSKKLLTYKKWSAGRSNNGRITVFSKGFIRKKRLPNLNYSFRMTCIYFVAGMAYTNAKSNLSSIIFLSNGGVSCIPFHLKDNFFYLRRLQKLVFKMSPIYKETLFWKPFIALYARPVLLVQQVRNTPISLLELRPLSKVKYVRSLGCKASLIKLDKRTGIGLVKLPSGLKKVFSAFSLASQGHANLNILKNRLNSTTSGDWRYKGFKSKVRGVAKNPVDHPHGGRTKSIKYPRTPWGKTTKFK